MSETPAAPRRVILGFTGVLRSGKDSAAAALLEDGATRVSFADVIRDFLYRLNPAVVHHGVTYRLALLVDALGWEVFKDTYPEVRALLQRCGTDAGRKVLGDDVWVNAAMAGLPPGDVVVSDVRFPNEADAIRAGGGFIVRVERPGYTAPEGAHASETAMDGYPHDYAIHNGGTLEQLHEQARAVAEHARTL